MFLLPWDIAHLVSAQYVASSGSCQRTHGLVSRTKGLRRFKKEVVDGRHDLKLPVISWAAVTCGEQPAQQETTVLQGSVFNRPVNPAVIHQVIRWQRALHRQVRD